MITAAIATLLDKAGSGLGKAFSKYKIGTELKAMQDRELDNLASAEGIAARFITKTLVADDIDTGAFAITVGFAFTHVFAALVLAANGSVRAVTKVVIGTGDDKGKITITATSVAATDVVSLLVG